MALKNKPAKPIKRLSRKQQRKEKRQEKKIRKNEFFSKKKLVDHQIINPEKLPMMQNKKAIAVNNKGPKNSKVDVIQVETKLTEKITKNRNQVLIPYDFLLFFYLFFIFSCQHQNRYVQKKRKSKENWSPK